MKVQLLVPSLTNVEIDGDKSGYGELGPVPAMALLAKDTTADILAFIHDDVTLPEGWRSEVSDFMEANPKCGLVGFGGALGLGHKDIYKKPYNLQQLERYSFVSNMRDAEIHGSRVKKPMRVAVLDGFSMCFRRQAYEDMGGWEEATKDGLPPHHMHDAWACCRMAEMGWEVYMLPLAVHHEGGSVSISPWYQDQCKAWGYKDAQSLFEEAHLVCYKRFRSVLPLRVHPCT